MEKHQTRLDRMAAKTMTGLKAFARCPLCYSLRKRSDFNLEHSIAVQALRGDPDYMKVNPQDRAGYIMLCSDCNKRKGKMFDGSFRFMMDFQCNMAKRKQNIAHPKTATSKSEKKRLEKLYAERIDLERSWSRALRASRIVCYEGIFKHLGFPWINHLDYVRADFATDSGMDESIPIMNQLLLCGDARSMTSNYDYTGNNSVFSFNANVKTGNLYVRSRHISMIFALPRDLHFDINQPSDDIEIRSKEFDDIVEYRHTIKCSKEGFVPISGWKNIVQDPQLCLF